METIETEKILTAAEMFKIVGDELKEKNAEIELLKTKKKIAVEMIKELLEFLEFIRNHPPFANDAKAYKWIMFQIEMMAARINEPEEER